MNATLAPSVLIADGDAALRSAASSFLAARGWLVDEAESGDAAADMLLARPRDVLVVDLATPVRSGMELLELAKRSFPSTRGILLGTSISSTDVASATRLGAVRVINKPVSLLALADAVSVAAECRDGFHGWLHRLSLVDLLQMFHLSGHSLTLSVHGPTEGRLTVSGGEIVHAETGELAGAAALVELLRARSGAIETSPLDAGSITITQPFDHLILDCLRQLDERPKVHPSKSILSSFGDFLSERAPAEHRSETLREWMEAHAPGGRAWLGDLEGGTLTPVDPSQESPSALAGVGTAIAMATATDATWTRAEVVAADVAIAILRRKNSLVVFAREGVGEELLRRFRLEVTQLGRAWEATDVA